MAKEFNDEWNELTQGSKLSKFLFINFKSIKKININERIF